MEIENNDYEDENGNYGRVGISIFDKAVPSPEANCEDLLKGCHCDNVTALGGSVGPLQR